jgi:hypothetical protein
MSTKIPSVERVRAALRPLTLKQIARLSALSDVPAPTIYKIRMGTTPNPGIETCRKFMVHIKAAQT